MKKNTLVAIVLALVIIVSAVQAFQLTALKAKVSSGGASIGSGATAAPTAAGTSASSGGKTVASSIAELPSMVGGC